MCMIEMVAHERFYKDVAHEPLCPAIPKDPRSRHTSPSPDVAPTPLPTAVEPPPTPAATLGS
jgi:hypothetical protein